MKKTIEVIKEDGRDLCLVPLGREGRKGTAKIWKDDLEFLFRLGLSPSWGTVLGAYVTAAARLAHGQHVMVARVLMDAGVGQSIRYLDGDRSNLRRENIQVVTGSGIRRDRDYLRVQQNKNLLRTSVAFIEGTV